MPLMQLTIIVEKGTSRFVNLYDSLNQRIATVSAFVRLSKGVITLLLEDSWKFWKLVEHFLS